MIAKWCGAYTPPSQGLTSNFQPGHAQKEEAEGTACQAPTKAPHEVGAGHWPPGGHGSGLSWFTSASRDRSLLKGSQSAF